MTTFYASGDFTNRDDCELLAKEYLKGDRIGRGASGTVYDACKKGGDCKYVLKVIKYDKQLYEMSGRVESKSRKTIKKAWENEVKILQKLNECQEEYRTNFVPLIYDAWFCTENDATWFYILMEKYEGNLDDFMRKFRSSTAILIAAVAFLKILELQLDIIHRTCKICLNNINRMNVLYRQVGKLRFEFVFADTGKATDEMSEKCLEDDRKRFERYITSFVKEMEG
jgi:serine/threonine protein kinase